MKNKSFLKHLTAIFLSSIIILLAVPYNFGHFSLEKLTWITIVVVSLMCFVLVEMVFFWNGIDRFFNISFRGGLLLLSIIVCVFTVMLYICQVIHYKFLGFLGYDLTIFLQMFWNTLNGGGFLYNSKEGVCHLFIHPVPMGLIALPFYAIYQHVYTLFFVQSIFFCCASLPLFLIASKRLNNVASIVISVGFLFYPFIIGPIFTSFRETAFLALFMFFAFHFFEQKRFGLYLLFALFAMMSRESAALTCLMFAIYGILNKRPIKWIVATVILGTSYFLLFLLAQEACGRAGYVLPTLPVAYDYSGTGSVMTAVIDKISNPEILIATVFDIENIKYIYKLLSPCALILPFLSIEVLFIIPQLLIVLLSGNQAFVSPMYHYSINASIFLWISTIFTVSKITNKKKITGLLDISKQRLSLAMVIFISLTALSMYHTWYPKYKKMASSYYEAANEAVSYIPQDASVSASAHFLPLVSERRRIAILSESELTDYILIDRTKQDGAERIGIENIKGHLAKEYRIVFDREGIVLYAKRLK